jgi:RNA polymerase sigma-70 factor, ECF subfamily
MGAENRHGAVIFVIRSSQAVVSREERQDISAILMSWSRGDAKALNELAPLIYDDLRLIARRHLGRVPASLLHSGSLVHETYLRLLHARGIQCRNRAHFFALCSQMIRRILVDQARRQVSAKHGPPVQLPLQEALLGTKAQGIEIEALDEALRSLAQTDPRKVRVVELRFFGGLSLKETAKVLEISEETVTRDWRMAKAWLLRELTREAVGV